MESYSIKGIVSASSWRHWPLGRFGVFLFVLLVTVALCAGRGFCKEGLYSRYVDPKGRYRLDYPSTMRLKMVSPDQVKIYHPQASLRIYVFVEKRRNEGEPTAAPLLRSLAARLEKEMGNIEIIDAKSPIKGDKRHGYGIFRFKNSRGVDLTQLVHYFAAKDWVLQLIISDKSKGYSNIGQVVDRVHGSLKVSESVGRP